MSPILRYYNLREKVTIQCDASQHGLGAVLPQGEQPVAYASRALPPTEENYEQIEKELLAIVFACEKFDACIYGRDSIRVQTDHKPLDSIFRKTVCSTKASSENALEVAEVRFGCNLPKRRDVDC